MDAWSETKRVSDLRIDTILNIKFLTKTGQFVFDRQLIRGYI